MQLRESGIILFCEHYEQALKFYTEKIGLQIRGQKSDLAVLDFGGSYLMIEDNGIASASPKTREQNPIVIRFNVDDFENTILEIKNRGVEVDVHSFNWGKIGVIIDPEGNRIEIKD
ncbi:lactoylglutathione lyase [Paenibacillus sp. V4I3]|uniref:VOC family protein n=1 Tax=Paenibacillus sp. V4I3 TaxID=3042305 RepID=UPI002780D011|nr:VOC family protein [Paenibacillus sp. V4I3]MDQ0874994.1 lactoylglutathione lyase [Paenibacillus sp. V4I3]